MAEAKKCDICGKLYEIYNEEKGQCPNNIRLMHVYDYRSANIVDDLDCCPDCLYQIGATIFDLQHPGKDETEFIKKKFNLPLEEETNGRK